MVNLLEWVKLENIIAYYWNYHKTAKENIKTATEPHIVQICTREILTSYCSYNICTW
jgi:hypothetical protein